MTAIHLGMAILASWRLTELVVADRLTAPLRQRWPSYVLSCGRCVSVWAGAVVTAVYLLWPWGNWPLGFAWLYLVHLDWVLARRMQHGPKRVILTVDEQRNVTIAQSDLPPEATMAVLHSFHTNGAAGAAEAVR